MTNRPIPRRGLLGCWFLTDRGITYDAGANEAIDRSGRGNHATYQNGVTVGVAGDPSRDFGAADFDAGSNQFVDVGDPLAVDGDQAIVAIIKPEDLANAQRYVSNRGSNGTLIDNGGGSGVFRFGLNDDNGSFTNVEFTADTGEWYSVCGAKHNGGVVIYDGVSLVDSASITGVNNGDTVPLQIGGQSGNYSDSEIAAVARYDLTVPNAPEPSEIARRWDRLTDIPATR